jgi:thioredoxin-related protein
MFQMTPFGRAHAPLHDISRRHVLVAGAALCVSAGARAATPASLPLAVSLADELAAALKQGNPLVVMVSLARCPFCIVARDHYLAPMRAQQALPVVQVDMRSALVVQDFKGDPLTHDQLVRRWGVKVAPTVLFFGPGGVEVAERLMGAYIPDFYGAYLDERLALARAAIKPKG